VTARSAPGPTVGYLTKRFPRLSETFILDEIIGLEQAGVPLRLFAVADPMEPVTQPDVSKVKSPVTYLRGQCRSDALKEMVRTVSAHARLAARSPSRYRNVLAMAVSDRRRTKTIRPFLDAGLLAIELRRAGAVHLHAAFAHGPAATARYVHHLTGLPYSFAAHAKDLYLTDAGELAAKAADAEFVLTCSSAAAEGLAQRLGAGEPSARDARAADSRAAGKVVLAYHGVDTGRFQPALGGGGAGALRVLVVGRLVPKKGYPVLLAALRRLMDEGHQITCRIVGEGPERAQLTALAERLGLGEKLVFLGARTHQEVAEEYGQADVFVQTSVVLDNGDRDGIPNSLLEAMASGLPVVASAVSGIPEAVDDGISGLLVPSGDAAALAGALSRVALSQTGGGQLARALGTGARAAVVERFDRQECARRLAPRFWPGVSAAAPELVHT
jgi:glycosyltransferase involved in cell wall biosynthesis